MTGAQHKDRRAVLFVAPQVPFPLDTGGKIRTFYQLRALARQYTVDLLALGPPLSGQDASDPMWRALASELRAVHCVGRDGLNRRGVAMAAARSLLGPLPWAVEKYSSPEARTWIARATGRGWYDAVHFDSLHTFRFADEVAPPARLVLDEHNVEALILERMAEVTGGVMGHLIAQQAARTDRFERASVQRAHRVLLCSDDDRALVAGRAGRQRGLEVIPNGVDLDRFDPEGPRREGPPYALFLGSMDWWPNTDAMTWFIREGWPALRARVPSLELKVVGRNPSEAMRALGGRDGIEIVGGVDDVRPWVRGCAVFLVPLRVGGGTRLKILEAMACGAPVVSTTLGCEGIELTHGRELLIADEAQAMVQAAAQVVEDRALATRLGVAGRLKVERRYSWTALGQRLVSVYDGLFRELGERD